MVIVAEFQTREPFASGVLGVVCEYSFNRVILIAITFGVAFLHQFIEFLSVDLNLGVGCEVSD